MLDEAIDEDDDGDDVPAALAVAVVEESIDMGAFRAALRHGSDAFADEPANDEEGDDDDDDEEVKEDDEVEEEDDGGVEEEAIGRDGAAADFRLP